jgi:hypothetical protein
MCKRKIVDLSKIWGVFNTVPIAKRAVALALLCALPATQASAQTCSHCPAEATATAIGVGFSILVNRGGQLIDVSGSAVGACEQLILSANLSYNRFGPGGAVGAGFTAGTGHIILPNGTAVNVTPANMGTTIIGPTVSIPGVLTACTAPVGTTLVDFKDMNTLNYNLTPADIAAGSAVFTFDYTNGLSQLPNAQGQCILRVRASPQQSVQIAPLPTCSIQPANQTVCVGDTATFTATTTGSGPFTFAWRKGCPGAGAVLSTSATLTINNAQESDTGCYELTVTDRFGCITTCQANLVVRPCNPRIQVHKQVVCVNPDGTCGPFNANLGTQKTASGVKDGSCPAFCYRITVINTSDAGIELRNLQVSDDSIPDPNLNLAACGFPTTLAAPGLPGDRASCIVPAVTHCQDTRDIVTASANGVIVSDGTAVGVVTARDTNDVRVLNINIVCESSLFSAMDTDGNPNDCNLTLPQAFTGPVTLTVTLRNTGTSPLDVTSLNGLPALVDCASGAPVVVSLPMTIAAGGSTTIQGCFDVTLNTCPTNIPINVTAHAEANDMNGTLCVYDSTGRRISDDSGPNECNCNITCIPVQEIECRVTGGGVLLPGGFDESCIRVDTTIFPMQIQGGLTVRKITHGGQLGAPFSHRDCGEVLGNQCIRGQWSHTRHYEGKANPRDVIDMSFHSTTPKGIYDSLLCACLGCCDPESGAFITPITIGGICNPDDHKICGPQPRPAPANVIIWSGIGKITPEDDTSGPRAARSEWVIYRTYIEDRSEPGGYHPGGAVEPADIYCFQAWKTGIRVSRKPDFSTVATDFRRRLGQANCDFLAALEAGALPIGTLPSPTVDGVTADIQDCGPMASGNHQIHPATGANDNCTP